MLSIGIKRSLGAVFTACLLAACQSAALPEGAPSTASVLRSGNAVLAQVKEKAQEPDLYFSAEGQYHSQPQAGGYVRRVLGKTADGSWVVQDFYQDNQAKQIDPALIFHPEGLRNFDNDVVHGRVVWYRKDGSLMQSVVFDRGVPQGWESHYDRQGRLRWLLLVEQGDLKAIQAFNEAGRMIVQVDARVGERQLWHDNGRLAVKERFAPLTSITVAGGDGEAVSREGWDEQGKSLDDTQTAWLMQYLLSKAYDLEADGED